jgi:transcriptional regulator with XRE-family HTH domain
MTTRTVGMKGIEVKGAHLRNLRHRKRLSGKKLADLTGHTVTQIYRVEGGMRTSMGFLDSLAEIFGEDAVGELIVNDDDRTAFLARDLAADSDPPDSADWRDWPALGRAVKERRQALRLGTQQEAAKRAGISLNTWGRLETGVPVRPVTLTQAARVLDWTEADMMRILLGESASDGAPGTATPSPSSATWKTVTGPEGVEVTVRLERADDGRQVITALCLEGSQITADILRSLRPAHIEAEANVVTTGERKPLSRPDGSDPEGFYRQVAEAYGLAAAESQRPAMLLASEAGVRRTYQHAARIARGEA